MPRHGLCRSVGAACVVRADSGGAAAAAVGVLAVPCFCVAAAACPAAVGDDAVRDRKASLCGETGIRRDSDADHQHVGIDMATI